MSGNALDPPKRGQVIRYSYLWRDEAARGQEEGVKDRPCAIVLAVQRDDAGARVYVAPITHTPPDDKKAVEIPADTKRRLGLDDARSWIVTNEMNVFTWPGPDVRPVSRGSREFVYGFLATDTTRKVVNAALEQIREKRMNPVERDEKGPARARRYVDAAKREKLEPEPSQKARDQEQEQ